MRIIVDLPTAVFDRAYRLIESGRYRSLNEAITAALETQLTLDETGGGDVISANAVIAGGGRGQSNGDAAPARMPEPARTSAGQATGPFPGLSLPISYSQRPAGMPPWEKVTEQRAYWLWGINRVAPVKVAARILVALAGRGNGWVELNQLWEEGGEMALRVGDHLAGLDALAGRKHGGKLSSGFPRSVRDAHKAARRFCALAIGDVRTKIGRVDGALYELRLAECRRVAEKSWEMAPTQAGLEFALIRSPILDSAQPERGLSGEEAAWYLDHVKRNVPWERDVLQQARELLESGRTGRHDFLDAFTKHYPGVTRVALESMRVCVLGRLGDLGVSS